MASLADMEAISSDGAAALVAAENGCADLVKVLIRGFNAGMIDKTERDTFVNDTQAIKHELLSLHSRLTAIAQRNNADGVIIAGGPGR